LIIPHNLPMPAPKTTGWLIGSTMHLLHLCLPDSDIGWEDLYWERSQQSWFDWTIPMTGVLLVTSILNAMHLFTQSKTYRLHRRTKGDPVSSPHTTFVTSPVRVRPDEPSPIASFKTRILRVIKAVILFLWNCFYFLLEIPAWYLHCHTFIVLTCPRCPCRSDSTLEHLFPCSCSYLDSTGPTNWILMTAVMGAVGVQTSLLVQAYEGLVKDRAILAAEVMHEYNEGFVYPRMNTMVNVWED
ncbi:uncharacterized protein EDB91DRAFT_1173566, partial [Suillus paluster]|uniref:uncharacterized protein n=1 Tax=Suillus paluster TaxID=48578 RepID=UPI001B8649EC